MNTPFLSSEDFDEQAHRLYQDGRYDEALTLLHDGLARYPDAANLHVGLAYVRVAREEYAWARTAFEAALAFEPAHEDAWVGVGDIHLRLGRFEAALECFARVDALGFEEDLEIGLSIGRALYREGLLEEAGERFSRLARLHPGNSDALAGCGFTLHALGEAPKAIDMLERAVQRDPDDLEAWVHLGHLRLDGGEEKGALEAFRNVPPEDHWDPWTVHRVMELLEPGSRAAHDERHAYLQRLDVLEGGGSSATDRLLAEIEADFAAHDADDPLHDAIGTPDPETARKVHQVRTADGSVFSGSWDEIVFGMRDELADSEEPITDFMNRAAERVRKLTGRELPCHNAEAFVRASATIGLLRIES